MSMCMYVARGPEAQLRELAEDAETLCGVGMAAFGGGLADNASAAGPFGKSAFANLGNTPEKLARIEELLGQQPQLRQAIGDVLTRIGAPPTAPSGGPVTAGDVVTLLSSLARGERSGSGRSGGPGGAKLAAGPGGRLGGGLGGGLGGAFGGRGGASAAPPRAPAGPAAGRPPVVDLHKSWHMFHFVFTGLASGGTPPANLLLEGGEEIGEDLGYGPTRLLDPATTAALAGFVAPFTVDELKRRLDGARMAALGIYPAFDATDAAQEYGDDVEHYFPLLRDHLAAAVAGREATLVWLS
jgi:hypothetical protein